MRFASITLAILLAPSIAMPQTQNRVSVFQGQDGVNLSPEMAARLAFLRGGCPIGLSAQRRGVSTMMTVDGRPQREPVPTVRLTLNNLQDKEIVGATVRVRGYSARPQVFPVSGANSAGELAKTVTFKLDVAQGKHSHTDVTAEKFGGISRIDLELVEYADGSVWRANSERSCSVEPSLFMLIAEK